MTHPYTLGEDLIVNGYLAGKYLGNGRMSVTHECYIKWGCPTWYSVAKRYRELKPTDKIQTTSERLVRR